MPEAHQGRKKYLYTKKNPPLRKTIQNIIYKNIK